MRTNFKLLSLLCLCCYCFASCTDKPTNVELQVFVKNSDGELINDASVKLDDELVGKTDEAGHFKVSKPIVLPAKKKIEITKDSDSVYFAPYYEWVDIAADATDISVNATLYSVPKPTQAEEESVLGATSSSDKSTSSGEIEIKPITSEVQEVETTKVEVVKEADTKTVENKAAQPTTSDADLAPNLKLIPVSPSTEDSLVSSKHPLKKHQDVGTSLFTIHVYSGETPLADSAVLFGESRNAQLKEGCRTNARGRCAIRHAFDFDQVLTFVATKEGYLSSSQSVPVKEGGTLRFDLKHGQAIDIFTIGKTYNFTYGIPNVDVSVKGKRVGSTDEFGFYSYPYQGKKSDLVDIILKSKGYMPENFETDFVVSGPMTLVKYFSPVKPPAVKVTLLKTQPAGEIKDESLFSLDSNLDKLLKESVSKHLFSSPAYSELTVDQFNKISKSSGKNLTSLVRKGWFDADIKGDLDAILLPTLIGNTPMILEISAIDSRGTILAAAKETLDNPNDASSIDQTIINISKRITETFPFEGAVLGREGDKININIGKLSGRGITAGTQLDVFGLQAAKYGQTQEHKKIATIVVQEVWDEVSSCDVKVLEPRSTISRGDLVVMRPRHVVPSASSQIKVVGQSMTGKNFAVGQANVYFNDVWVGATDNTGRLYVDPKQLGGSGVLKVIRYGFRDFSKEVRFDVAQNVIEIKLVREMVLLRVESKPSGAKVHVEGRLIGTTPLSSPVPVPTGFIKVDVGGVKDYKTYSTVLELDEGTFELTGNNAIELEIDYIDKARKLIASNKITEGVDVLLKIPKNHTDYLLANHDAGEIYLTRMSNPERASELFAAVTQDPQVQNFIDKRFIGSHINEAMALFMVADKLMEDDNKEEAIKRYTKSLEVFDKVLPQLRFVPNDQYESALHSVYYHIALAKQNLWKLSQKPSVLQDTVKAWQTYLDGPASKLTANINNRTYLERARSFYKQAQFDLNNASK